MKTIKLRNESINRLLNLLNKAPMKNKASRGKIKFMVKLQEKEAELTEGRVELQKDYFVQDKNGEFIVDKESNSLIYKDEESKEKKDEFVSRIVELMQENFEISFNEYEEKFEAMFDSLDNLDMELSEDIALAYDELMDAYEKNS